MTVSSPRPTVASDRDPDLIVAHAHLRLGSLGLARAELETLAGRDRLDDEGVRDLAEARWRTGDTAGAGEAAVAYLDVDSDDVLALVIAAEAQVDLGRPAEARRLVSRAMERADGSLDPIFAGMKRSSVWPVDGDAAAAPAGVLFDDLHPSPIATDGAPGRRAGDRRPSGSDATFHAPLDPGIPSEIASGPGLWDDHPPAAPSGDGAGVDADRLVHAARTALDDGQPAIAATGLILALRAAPHLAPAVLDLLSGRSDPILVLVRGDAGRIVGREGESARDHSAAAQGVVQLSGAAPDGDVGSAAASAGPVAEAEPAAADPALPPADDAADTAESLPAVEPSPVTLGDPLDSIDQPSQEDP